MNAKTTDTIENYAARGWAIFPLAGKTPRVKWRDVSTTDPNEIHALFAKRNGANIGLDCGKSGLVVIDLDVKGDADGLATWHELGIGDTAALVSQTGGGGQHLIFRDTSDGAIGNSAGKLGPGVDVRGNGGYIVLPPSIHPDSGKPYLTLGDWNREPGPIPALLADLLTESEPTRTPRPAPRPGGNGKPDRYADAALANELATLARAQDGSRNHQLNTSAFNLGQFVAAGRLDQAHVERALSAAAVAIGLGEHEARATIESGMDSGAGHPRWPDAQPGTQGQPTGDTDQVAPTPAHRTDMGNAQRLVAKFSGRLRYCYTWGKWLAWDGIRWVLDDTGAVIRCGKETTRHLYTEAGNAESEAERKAVAKWAMASESRTRIDAMIALAESEPGIPVRPDDLDANPWLLNVQNGTIDLKTGNLGMHLTSDGITKLAPVDYDPSAKAPTWDAFLDRVLAGNQELISFLQRAVGYALTANTSEQAFFILYGSGANGKTTFLQAISHAMGDYAQQTPTETLLIKRTGAIPNDVARLKGTRLVTAIEADEGRRMAESLVKQMTGGDKVAARFLHREWFEFEPTFKIFLGTNHKPTIQGTDHAIWRRIRLIPFEVTIPKAEQNPGLGDKLAEELPGILAWAVRGCLDWQVDGLGMPTDVKAATEGYRQEMDILGGFLGDCCVMTPEAQARAGQLYAAYEEWCKTNGEKAITGTKFGTNLTERGYTKHKDRGGWSYSGIGLETLADEL